jgi:hypothetical protein
MASTNKLETDEYSKSTKKCKYSYPLTKTWVHPVMQVLNLASAIDPKLQRGRKKLAAGAKR